MSEIATSRVQTPEFDPDPPFTATVPDLPTAESFADPYKECGDCKIRAFLMAQNLIRLIGIKPNINDAKIVELIGERIRAAHPSLVELPT